MPGSLKAIKNACHNQNLEQHCTKLIHCTQRDWVVHGSTMTQCIFLQTICADSVLGNQSVKVLNIEVKFSIPRMLCHLIFCKNVVWFHREKHQVEMEGNTLHDKRTCSIRCKLSSQMATFSWNTSRNVLSAKF